MQYMQQELDHLRDQLHQQVSNTSRLEGENRQLQAQLRDLKADKLAAEQQVQQLQGESLRHKLAKEQALKERMQADEQLQLLQQQLDAARQQRSKTEAERDQITLEKQSLFKEAQRLQGLVAELDRDKRQLQEQLKQQQEKQHLADEKYARDQQASNQIVLNLQASMEQTKNELKR